MVVNFDFPQEMEVVKYAYVSSCGYPPRIHQCSDEDLLGRPFVPQRENGWIHRCLAGIFLVFAARSCNFRLHQ